MDAGARRWTSIAVVALAAAALALPAGTAADPRPTGGELHDCHATHETAKIRITHIAANRFAAAHHQTGCQRAVHLATEYASKDSCVGTHPVSHYCSLGPVDHHSQTPELSCRQTFHVHDGHLGSCKKQSTGAHINYSWHRKH